MLGWSRCCVQEQFTSRVPVGVVPVGRTNSLAQLLCPKTDSDIVYVIIIIISINDIYIAQVRKGHKCAMSAEMAVWLRNCLYLYSYLSHN